MLARQRTTLIQEKCLPSKAISLAITVEGNALTDVLCLKHATHALAAMIVVSCKKLSAVSTWIKTKQGLKQFNKQLYCTKKWEESRSQIINR